MNFEQMRLLLLLCQIKRPDIAAVTATLTRIIYLSAIPSSTYEPRASLLTTSSSRSSAVLLVVFMAGDNSSMARRFANWGRFWRLYDRGFPLSMLCFFVWKSLGLQKRSTRIRAESEIEGELGACLSGSSTAIR